MSDSLYLGPTPKKRTGEYFPLTARFPICADESSSSKRKIFTGYLQDNCVIVTDEDAIIALYTMGFFGKSTLSRGGPKICFQKNRDQSPSTTSSEVRDAASDTPDPENENETSSKDESSPRHNRETEEEQEPDITSTTNASTEHLQLTFEEAFFLSYGLGVFLVVDKQQRLDLQALWMKLCDLTPNGRFPFMYAAYHYFRSKGWVVKGGLKYGTDYVLYKDGPIYYHSTYAVVVKPVAEKNLKDLRTGGSMSPTWTSLAAQERVMSHVAKALMYLYVIKPDSLSENKLLTPYSIPHFLIQEMIVKRWVPSAGREEEEDDDEIS